MPKIPITNPIVEMFTNIKKPRALVQSALNSRYPGLTLGEGYRQEMANIHRWLGDTGQRFVRPAELSGIEDLDIVNPIDIAPYPGMNGLLGKTMRLASPSYDVYASKAFVTGKQYLEKLSEQMFYRVGNFLGAESPHNIESLSTREISAAHVNFIDTLYDKFNQYKSRAYETEYKKKTTPHAQTMGHGRLRVEDKLRRASGQTDIGEDWQGFLGLINKHRRERTPLADIPDPEVRDVVLHMRESRQKFRERLEAEKVGLLKNIQEMSDEDVLLSIAKDRDLPPVPKDTQGRTDAIAKWKAERLKERDDYYERVYDQNKIRKNPNDFENKLINRYNELEKIAFRDIGARSLTRIKNTIDTLELEIEFKQANPESQLKGGGISKTAQKSIDKKTKKLELEKNKLEKETKAIQNETQKQFEVRRNVQQQKIREAVSDIKTKILHSKTGMLDNGMFSTYKINGKGNIKKQNTAKFLNRRKLEKVQDSITEYMVDDPVFLFTAYNRTMIPQLIAKELRINIDDFVFALRGEKDSLIKSAGNNSAKAVALEKEANRIAANVLAIWKRVMNADFPEPGNFTSITNDLLKFNNLTKMNNVMLASFPDIGRILSQHGLGNFKRMLYSFSKNREVFRAEMARWPKYGVGADLMTSATFRSTTELLNGSSGTWLSPVIDALSGPHGLITMINQWNAAWKQFVALLSTDELLSIGLQLKKGVGPADLAQGETALIRILNTGLEEEQIISIFDEWVESGGHVYDGFFLSNADNWESTVTKELFLNHIYRRSNRTIITPPAGSKPKIMSENAGRLVGQYKSFGLAAMHAIVVSGMQMPDARAMSGGLIGLFFGWVSYMARAELSGRPISDKPQDHLLEAIDRSGLIALFMDGNRLIERATAGRAGLPAVFGGTGLTRFAADDFTKQFFGPWISTIDSGAQAIAGAAQSFPGGNVQRHQIDARWRMTPLSNIWYFNWLTNMMKDAEYKYWGVEE